MANSLVTGGAGFIGSHVVDHLIAMGHNVVVLDELSGGYKENVNQQAVFVKGSILDIDLIKKVFDEHSFDYVFHLAAYAAEGLSHFIRNYNYSNNILGSVNLINAAVNAKVKCFVFTSSIAVYGASPLPMREEDTPCPTDPYGIAKYAVELDLKAANELFGIDYVIFRPHNVYGIRQNLSDPYRNVLGIFINQALQGKPLTIYGNGSQTRAFSYIDDVAPYIAKIVEVPRAYNQVYNVGDDHTYTVKEIAEMILNKVETQSTITYLDARHEVRHAHTDHHKLRTIFHLEQKDKIKLQDGLDIMLEWAKEQDLSASHLFDAYEIDHKMPQNWKL